MSAPGSTERLPDRRYRRVLLLGSVFVVAACGLGYELIAGAVSTYLIGDPVTQFSLVVGAFLSAMGLGAYLSQHIRRNLLGAFVELELGVALVGGASSVLIFATSVYLEGAFEVVFYSLCVAIGAMVGAEIPLLVRILRQDGRDLSEALSSTLALDYFGALAGAIILPLLALPYLGLSRVSVVFGLLNLTAAILGSRLMERPSVGLRARIATTAVTLVALLGVSPMLVSFFEDELYDDAIVYARSSAHQRIVLTRFRADLRLYLNGHIQFSSIDEARYHEALVLPAMEAAGAPRSVLVLGGGDGMVVREVLGYESVESVTLVDLDPAMTRLGRERAELVRLNEGSLRDPRVRIVHRDALGFLRHDERFYDVIIADLPDPSSAGLARLYSVEAYTSALRRLSANGVFVTHATSPFFAREAFWSIVATVEAALTESMGTTRHATPYHLHVPSFGEWGFVIVAPQGRDPRGLEPSVPTDYLNAEAWRAMFAFGLDLTRPESATVNRLSEPVLHVAYRRGWQSY